MAKRKKPLKVGPFTVVADPALKPGEFRLMQDPATTYPEHDKLRMVKNKSQAIHEFMIWLQEEHHYFLAFFASGERIHPVQKDLTKLVAEFLDIDLDALEDEKRKMLEGLRAG